MPALTTKYDRIIQQPALTMPGNAAGSEAPCTALTGSQIRAICGLGTTDNVTFNTVTATTSVLTPLVNNAAAALTLGNSTYGVTVPGAAVVSGDISMQKATQGYIRAYATDGVKNIAVSHNGSNGVFATSSGANTFTSGTGQNYFFDSTGVKYLLLNQSGNIGVISTNAGGAASMQIATDTGQTGFYSASSNSSIVVYSAAGAKNTTLTHDNTNGILSTSSGPLLLQAAAQEVHVYNPGGTASLVVYNSGKTAAISTYHNGTNGVLVTNTGGIVLDPSGSCQVLSATHIQESSGSAEHYIRCSTSTGYSALYLDETTGSGTLTRYNSAWSVAARRGVTRLSATAGIELGAGNGRYYFGAIDNTRPSITATSTTFAVRLGDDSADAPISCAGITASGAIQETYRTSSLDPTVSDIGSGKRQGWYNTTATEFRDWVNVGGTLYKSAVYT